MLDQIYENMRRTAESGAPALAQSDALRGPLGRPTNRAPISKQVRTHKNQGPQPDTKTRAIPPGEGSYPHPKLVPAHGSTEVPDPGAAAAAPEAAGESNWTRFMKWFTEPEKDPADIEALVLRKAKELGMNVDIVRAAFREAQKQGVDYRMVLAVIEAESAFDPNARSPAGARGLMQIMPATARGDLGVADVDDLYSITVNIRAGVTYLGRLWNQFSETSFLQLNALNPYTRQDVQMALAAYNAGPGRVAKLGRVPRIPETRDYVVKVLRAYVKYRSVFPAPAD